MVGLCFFLMWELRAIFEEYFPSQLEIGHLRCLDKVESFLLYFLFLKMIFFFWESLLSSSSLAGMGDLQIFSLIQSLRYSISSLNCLFSKSKYWIKLFFESSFCQHPFIGIRFEQSATKIGSMFWKVNMALLFFVKNYI